MQYLDAKLVSDGFVKVVGKVIIGYQLKEITILTWKKMTFLQNESFELFKNADIWNWL